jgi:hypothetical protein
LSLIFVYFLLSAQYESYLVPLSILLSLPVGVAGAIGFVYLSGWKTISTSGRFDHAYRVARQECHFDRRICHTKATQRNGFDKTAIEAQSSFTSYFNDLWPSYLVYYHWLASG